MDFWEWIFGIIGVVAFIMAIQPFTQAIWGRPKLSIRYEGNGKTIQVVINNMPVKNKFLQKIGVYRMPISDICAFYWITLQNNSTKIDSDRAILKYGNIQSEHISLPSAWIDGAVFDISPQIRTSFFNKAKEGFLESGIYTIHINVIYDGNNLYISNNAIVHTMQNVAYIEWEKNKYTMQTLRRIHE